MPAKLGVVGGALADQSVPNFETVARALLKDCPGWCLVRAERDTESHGMFLCRAVKGSRTVEARGRFVRESFDLLRREIARKDITISGVAGPRICFVGWGRHGKDTAAFALHGKGPFHYYGSTSWAALPEVAEKLGIPEQIAWEQRHNNRQFWKDYCGWLRRDDPCYLIRKVLARGNICGGIRDLVEIQGAIKERLFDDIVWIDRPSFPADPTVTFTRDLATHTLYNNGTEAEFIAKVKMWALERGYLQPYQIH